MIIRRPFGVGFLLELFVLDDKALVGGAANFAGVVIHHGAEGQLAAVHGGQFTFAAHHHANGCGGVVGQFQLGANGAAAGVQLRGNALPAGFSTNAARAGVANTFSSPLPMAAAVLAAVTATLALPLIPGFSIVQYSFYQQQFCGGEYAFYYTRFAAV